MLAALPGAAADLDVRAGLSLAKSFGMLARDPQGGAGPVRTPADALLALQGELGVRFAHVALDATLEGGSALACGQYDMCLWYRAGLAARVTAGDFWGSLGAGWTLLALSYRAYDTPADTTAEGPFAQARFGMNVATGGRIYAPYLAVTIASSRHAVATPLNGAVSLGVIMTL